MKYLLLTLIFSLTACGNSSGETVTLPEIANAEPVEAPTQNGLKKAYFASGCFWCVEAVFESVVGVKEAISGYSGGHTENPTYEESNTGRTGHAEAVEVIYDPEIIDFETLTDVYFGSMDPTQKNGQGPDIGSQYRSIIFYQNAQQKKIIEQKLKELAEQYKKAIAVEVLPFQKFWKAEDYHQNYKKYNPNDPYIRNVSVPRMNRFKNKFPQLLKENQPD
jgi:peptide-methionine (S)-S-oxide reductase